MKYLRPVAHLLVSSLALFAHSAMAAATEGPLAGVTVTVDGQPTTFLATDFFGANEKKLYAVDNVKWGNDASNLVSAMMNPDPFITAAASGLDIGAASNFAFNWVLPMVPTTGPVTLKLTVAGSCTDSNNTGGCSITPTLGGFLAEGQLDGVTFISGGSAFSGPVGGSGAFASTTFTVTVPGSATYTTLGLNLGFLGSGNGDAFSFSLGVEVLPTSIPEPGSIALVALALAAAGTASRRRAA